MTQDKKENNNSNPEQKAEETVGELLRRTRLAKKQDLRDIASYLCIRYQFLEALEEGHYRDLPGDAYANGFIRSYAAYLGLNPADIITRYKREYFNHTNRENERYVMSSEEAENIVPDSKVLIISVLLLLGAFGLWHVSSKEKEVIPLQTEAQTDSITVTEHSYPLPETDAATVKKDDENQTSAGENVAPVPPVPPVKPEIGRKEAVVSEPVAAVEPPVVERKAEAEPEPRVYGQKNYRPRLILSAKEETWIEVTRGETVVFSRLLKAGDQYWVSSLNPGELFLKTGNAGGLEVICDGKLTQALGPRGALRSNIALIPDDFAAKVVEDIE